MKKPPSIEKLLSLDSLNETNEEHYRNNRIDEVLFRIVSGYINREENQVNLPEDFESNILKEYLVERLSSHYHELGFKSYPKYELNMSEDNKEDLYREEVILHLKSLGLNDLYDIYRKQG